MLARHVVLLTPSKSSHPTQLLSYQQLVPVSPLTATLIVSLVSVANKRLATWLNPLDATLTKKHGGTTSFQPKARYSPRTLSDVPDPSPIFRMHFQVPYPVSPLFATLTKTAGVCTNNSHSGTRLTPDVQTYKRSGVQTVFLPPATLFHSWLANDSVNTSSPIFTGAKRSLAPFAFRRIPLPPSQKTSVLCEPRFIGTSIVGSKLVRGMVK